jgi:hypothetical protein
MSDRQRAERKCVCKRRAKSWKDGCMMREKERERERERESARGYVEQAISYPQSKKVSALPPRRAQHASSIDSYI